MNSTSPPAIPQEQYVICLLQAARRLELEGDRIFRQHELTLAQFNVLNHLRHFQPMPQSALVQSLVVGKATVSSLVGGLLKRNLLTQTVDPRDRRANTLQLSAEGTLLWHAASKAYFRSLKKLLPRVRGAEVAALRQALSVGVPVKIGKTFAG